MFDSSDCQRPTADSVLPYDLAIFDFDGTLADSWRMMARAISEAADVFGYRRLTADQAQQLRGQDNRAVMAAMGVRMWQLPRIAVHMRQVALERASEVRLFGGVDVLLPALVSKGVRVAVVSSNSEAVVRQVLGPALSECVHDFDCGAAIFGKASKFRRVVRRAGVVPGRAVGIGDEVRDIEAARAAGIAAIAVTWGYATAEILARHAPDHVVRNVEELRELLVGEVDS
jgi:phosphoglycolate phosphatase